MSNIGDYLLIQAVALKKLFYYWIAGIIIKKKYPDLSFDAKSYWFKTFDEICHGGDMKITSETMLDVLMVAMDMGFVNLYRSECKRIIELITNSSNGPRDSVLVPEFYMKLVKLNCNKEGGKQKSKRISCELNKSFLMDTSLKSISVRMESMATVDELKKFTARRIAKVFTLMDHHAILSINLSTLLSDHRKASAIFKQRCELMTNMFVGMILTSHSNKDRVYIMNEIINIAWECVALKNYQTASTLVYTLYNSFIDRLKPVHAKMSRSMNERLDELKNIFVNNPGMMQQQFERLSQPKIPQLWLICSGIELIDNYPGEFVKQESSSSLSYTINWDYVKTYERKIRDLIKFNQLSGYGSKIQKDMECELFIKRALDPRNLIRDEDLLEKLSHAIHPPPRKQRPPLIRTEGSKSLRTRWLSMNNNNKKESRSRKPSLSLKNINWKKSGELIISSPRTPRLDIINWTNDIVCNWITGIGMEQHEQIFREHMVTGKDLIELTQDDLCNMKITRVHDYKTILREKNRLISHSCKV